MSNELESFLYSLATEPDLLERFRKHPDEVVQETNLSPEECHIVLSGDMDAISDRANPPVPPILVIAASEGGPQGSTGE